MSTEPTILDTIRRIARRIGDDIVDFIDLLGFRPTPDTKPDGIAIICTNLADYYATTPLHTYPNLIACPTDQPLDFRGHRITGVLITPNAALTTDPEHLDALNAFATDALAAGRAGLTYTPHATPATPLEDWEREILDADTAALATTVTAAALGTAANAVAMHAIYPDDYVSRPYEQDGSPLVVVHVPTLWRCGCGDTWPADAIDEANLHVASHILSAAGVEVTRG